MNKFVIRVLDVFLSCFILLVAFPLLIVTYLIIRFRMGSPVIFSQQRLGYENEDFLFYKFRSMINDSNLSDKERITPFGKLIRKTSIDELPQLFNVIKGDMSIVGPRPLLPEYKEHYTQEQLLRHSVKPGITGWAQVNGRNTLTWDEKFE